jgi:hypothetical protein
LRTPQPSLSGSGWLRSQLQKRLPVLGVLCPQHAARLRSDISRRPAGLAPSTDLLVATSGKLFCRHSGRQRGIGIVDFLLLGPSWTSCGALPASCRRISNSPWNVALEVTRPKGDNSRARKNICGGDRVDQQQKTPARFALSFRACALHGTSAPGSKAREVFAAALKHRPRIRLTIRQRTQVLEQ